MFPHFPSTSWCLQKHYNKWATYKKLKPKGKELRWLFVHQLLTFYILNLPSSPDFCSPKCIFCITSVILFFHSLVKFGSSPMLFLQLLCSFTFLILPHLYYPYLCLLLALETVIASSSCHWFLLVDSITSFCGT